MLRGPMSSRAKVYGFLLLIAVLGGGAYLVKYYLIAHAAAKAANKRQEKAGSQIENSRKEVARIQHAFDEKLISEREVDQEKYRLDEFVHDERISSVETRELTHRVEELDAEIRQAELEISRTQI